MAPSKPSQSFSQKNRKRKVEDENHCSQSQTSQPTITQILDQTSKVLSFENQVNIAVRFIISKAGSKIPIIRRTQLQKLIKAGRQMNNVLEASNKILQNVYGYKLIYENDSTIFVFNDLGVLPDQEFEKNNVGRNGYHKDSKKVILMLILMHIFMTIGDVNEASLYSFLRSLQIDPERKHDSIYGNVQDYINNVLVKQQYILIEKNSTTNYKVFKWGPRALSEVSKLELLKLAGKMNKTSNIEKWTLQYEEAKKQDLELGPSEDPVEQNESIYNL